jgi:hypothetical protein
MLSTILIVVVVLIAGILALAATKPDSFQVQRRAMIDAPPDRIFALINDFHQWGVWSPWEKLDPAMKRTFDGPAAGVGSSYAWEGNSKAGQGRMEITESTSPSRLRLNLNFIKPFKANNVTEFNLAPKGNGTDVTWTLSGPSPFVTKLMMVFTTMDKMVGKDFEEGLANLKRVTESPS